ncbi:MAG: hypothetical protein ACHQ50_07695 [Fimbriimonadales bacterium]
MTSPHRLWTFFVVLSLVVAASSQSSVQPRSNGFGVLVASVDGMGIPIEHAVNVLKHGGISAGAMGSLGYGIFVPKEDAAKAKAILVADAKDHPYDYASIEGFKGKLGLPDESKWPFRKFHIYLDKIDAAPELRADANLRGLAREAALKLKSWEPGVASALPFISGMRLFTMEYMNAKGGLETGYKAVVYVSYSHGKGSYELYMYSWNQGRKHQTRGGGGSFADKG